MGLRDILISPADSDRITLIKAVVCEYLCMTLFLFFTIGTVSSNCHTRDVFTASGAADKSLVGTEFGSCALQESRLFTIAAAFGFAIFVLVYVAASFSGGHLNPAVTLGLLIGNQISVLRAVLYIVAQCLGACTGAGLVRAIDANGWHAAGGGTNSLSPGITGAAGWGLETVLTFTLVFVVFAATDAERATDAAHIPVLAPFAIGMDVFLCHMVAIPLDGCSINPARSFGASAVAGKWTDQWVFWVGPWTGAVLAALVYNFFFRTAADKGVALNLEGDKPQGAFALPGFSGAGGLQETDVAATAGGGLGAFTGAAGLAESKEAVDVDESHVASKSETHVV